MTHGALVYCVWCCQRFGWFPADQRARHGTDQQNVPGGFGFGHGDRAIRGIVHRQVSTIRRILRFSCLSVLFLFTSVHDIISYHILVLRHLINYWCCSANALIPFSKVRATEWLHAMGSPQHRPVRPDPFEGVGCPYAGPRDCR